MPNMRYIKYFLYMDDLLMTSSDPDLHTAGQQMQMAIDGVQRWAALNGFTFGPTKTSAVHFTDKRGLFNLPTFHLDQVQIKFEESLKFLGLIFDRRLTFRQHIQSVRSKCNKAMNIIKTISSHQWGADQECILRVYRALVRSRMDYGGIVYGSASATALEMLEPVANEAMRYASGAFRTTPVATLRNICCEPSLSLRRKRMSINYYLKIRSLINNPAFESVTNIAHESLFSNRSVVPSFALRVKNSLSELGIPRGPELPIKPDVKQSEYTLRSRWTLQSPEVDVSLGGHLKESTPNWVYQVEFQNLIDTRYSTCECIFTDGSKTQDSVGCAAVYRDQTSMQSLPTNASIFTAEIQALKLAINIIRSSQLDNILICSDSRSALQAVKNPYTNNPIVSSVQLDFDELLTSGRNIAMCWIPGHANIQGNETADKKAKLACQQTHTFFPLPYSDYYPLVENGVNALWTSEWRNSNNKMLKVKDHVKKWVKQEGFSRRDEVVFNRLRAGHTRLTHSYLMEGIPAPPVCPLCDNSIITVEHIMLNCESLSEARRGVISQHSTLETMLGRSIPKSVYGYVHEIGLFNET